MKTWRFCSVGITGKVVVLFYLCDETVREGDLVLVPLGSANEPVLGKVYAVNDYGEQDVPYPVEKSKSVLKKVTPEEAAAFQASAVQTEANPRLAAELKQVEEFIEAEDLEKLFSWACQHHNCITSPAAMAKVVECYEICLKNGMQKAAMNLGTLYYLGTYLPQDYCRAAELYEIAAKLGERQAICNLGYCYYYGRHQAVDYVKAYEYFSKGALLFNDENCLYKLGDMFLNGYGVEKNVQYAFMLYRRAYMVCDYDESECWADIEFRLGKCALYGIGRGKSAADARRHLSKALDGFYERCGTDPFVRSLIQGTKEMMRQAECELERTIPDGQGGTLGESERENG